MWLAGIFGNARERGEAGEALPSPQVSDMVGTSNVSYRSKGMPEAEDTAVGPYAGGVLRLGSVNDRSRGLRHVRDGLLRSGRTLLLHSRSRPRRGPGPGYRRPVRDGSDLFKMPCRMCDSESIQALVPGRAQYRGQTLSGGGTCRQI
jgi:hypothetical protein